MGAIDSSEDWRAGYCAGWQAGMAAAAAECRRIVREGKVVDNDDQKIGALEAALAILDLKRSGDK